MNAWDWILISFIIVYFVLESVFKHFVELDVARHSDNMSPERRAWHSLSFFSAGLLVVLLSAIIIYRPDFHISTWKFVAISMLVRGITMTYLKNILDKRDNILYIAKENFIEGKVHWIAGNWIPAEILMVAFYVILFTLIIIL